MMYGYNGDSNDYGYGMMDGYGFHSGYGYIIVIILILIIGFAIYKIFFNHSTHQNDGALEILKMKFVQGEITEDEYLRRKKIIQSK